MDDFLGVDPSSSVQIKLVVADSQRLVGEALAGVLGHVYGFDLVGQVPTTGIATIETVLAERPDVALIDYWMADMEGHAIAGMILAKQPTRKIIVMSWFHGTREIEISLQAGVVGFFPKSMALDHVAEGIRRAHEGESPVYLDELEAVFRRITKRSDEAASIGERLASLSSREIQVLTLLSLHLSNEQVAVRLGISPTTVKAHIRNILSKTNSLTSKEVVNLALACGLIRP